MCDIADVPHRTSETRLKRDADVIVIGAGAAGLATAIFTARAAPDLAVRVLDGAARIGAKILVSGGSRCNVTNRIVTERDFQSGSPRTVQRVLRAFPADRTAAFFEAIGVALHEEAGGKLFPTTNRSRTVLEALLAEATRRRVTIETGQRVTAVTPSEGEFIVETAQGRAYRSRAVVLATGGRSLPKSGSDGAGYDLARRLGHGYVETTPALVPLVLGGDAHRALSGVSHRAALTLRAHRRSPVRIDDPLLWTHFGLSGPAALDLSRHWHRARLDAAGGDPPPVVLLNLCPGETHDTLDRWLQEEARARPRARVATVLSARLPAAVAEAWLAAAGVSHETTLAHLSRDGRRRLLAALLETPLDVRDSRGYTVAEVTAGGIPLDEIDHATLESRVCKGLYLVGEILDVDGRLGGFNFQWAWSSAFVAAQGLRRLAGPARPDDSGTCAGGPADGASRAR